MRKFFKYFGSKIDLYKNPLIPEPLPGLPIIEPFAGSASYSCKYGANRSVVLSDTDERVCSLWEYLIGASKSDIESIPADGETVKLVSRTGREYSKIIPSYRGRVSDLRISDGAKMLVSCWVDRHKPFSDCFGNISAWHHSTRKNISLQVDMIRGWRVLHGSYDLCPDVEATWVFDPPYQITKDLNKKVYTRSDIDYSRLAEFVLSRRGLVIVHDLIGADWLPFQKLQSNVNIKAGKPVESTEAIFVRYQNG